MYQQYLSLIIDRTKRSQDVACSGGPSAEWRLCKSQLYTVFSAWFERLVRPVQRSLGGRAWVSCVLRGCPPYDSKCSSGDLVCLSHVCFRVLVNSAHRSAPVPSVVAAAEVVLLTCYDGTQFVPLVVICQVPLWSAWGTSALVRSPHNWVAYSWHFSCVVVGRSLTCGCQRVHVVHPKVQPVFRRLQAVDSCAVCQSTSVVNDFQHHWRYSPVDT